MHFVTVEHQALELEQLIAKDMGDLELTDEGLGGEGEPDVEHIDLHRSGAEAEV